MLAAHVKRGVAAGAVAGLVFGLLVALVANPLVGFADGLADGGAHAAGDGSGAAGAHHGEPSGESARAGAVPAPVADGISVLGGLLWGVLLGGVVFGAVHYVLEPALPDGAAGSYLLAGAGFVTVSGAPWLALPPRPPGVEPAMAAGPRLALYGVMMAAGALACLLAGRLYARVRDARGRVVAAAAAVLPFVPLAIPAVLSPAPPAIPAALADPAGSPLPPDLAAGLTGLVVFGQALLWLLLAGVHARLRRWTEGDGRPAGVPSPRDNGPAVGD